MLIPVLRHGRIVVLAYGMGLVGVLLAAFAEKAVALTPKSPEVREAIDKGIAYLRSDAASDERLGAIALHGHALWMYKLYSGNGSDARVFGLADKLHAVLNGMDASKLDTHVWDIYSVGLSIVFLADLGKKNENKYREDVECLLAFLRKYQKSSGGWGYPPGHQYEKTGDTSMTQYAVLSSWTAKHAGFDVPKESVEAVAEWLLKTQDPKGGWGYQGKPGGIRALVPQDEVRPSLAAAGSGSLYICASFLGITHEKENKEEKLPSALKEIKEKTPVKERPNTRIDVRAVYEAEENAKRWLAEHSGAKNVPMWVDYYLYALERCMAFRESYENTDESEPDWYNDGAEFLMKSQGRNGDWTNDQAGPVCDTAFAVLFLMRSTRQVVGQVKHYNQGMMIGGRGIPKNTDQIERNANGNIVARPLLGPGERLLAALENPDSREFDKSADLLEQLPADEVEKLKAKYGDKIRRLVSSKSAEARLAAVQMLAREGRNLDNVETLIYALTDPDYRVVRAANEALLRIRRVPTAAMLPDTLNEEDHRRLVETWKAWYQTIRPSAEVKY